MTRGEERRERARVEGERVRERGDRRRRGHKTKQRSINMYIYIHIVMKKRNKGVINNNIHVGGGVFD